MPKLTFNTLLGLLAVGLLALFVGRYFYMQPSLINGERAPDFEAELLDGNAFALSELQGQYVLIDFWGSWCPPCRKENPELVALYDKYHSASFQDAKGFTIVNIGVEEQEARWKKAIKQDQLHWPYHIFDQASSLRFFDSRLAELYGVKQVPTKYLLNPDGRIIAVDPSAEQTDKILAEASSN